jgi:hypothetical protein
VWYNGFRTEENRPNKYNPKEEIVMLEWTKEVQADPMKRMEFHLQKIDEGIKQLEGVGLDIVAKKLRDAHKMLVKDLNEKWSPNEDKGDIALVIVEHRSAGVPEEVEDIVKELQRQAKKNSRVGEY